MYYCGEYNFTDIWVDSGINRCFYETVWSIVLVVFMTIVGSGQLANYAKYGRRIDPNFKPSAVGLVLQITIVVILMNEVMVHVILHDTTIGTRDLSGSHVVVLQHVLRVVLLHATPLLGEERDPPQVCPGARVRPPSVLDSSVRQGEFVFYFLEQ